MVMLSHKVHAPKTRKGNSFHGTVYRTILKEKPPLSNHNFSPVIVNIASIEQVLSIVYIILHWNTLLLPIVLLITKEI